MNELYIGNEDETKVKKEQIEKIAKEIKKQVPVKLQSIKTEILGSF